MLIGELMVALPEAVLMHGDDSLRFDSVEVESRLVQPGALFCCLQGRNSDGHLYVSDALTRGASAVLTAHPLELHLPEGVAELRVSSGAMRAATARAASLVVGQPASALRLVGVTGTNGKTTVVNLLGQILGRAGFSPSVIGTLSGERTTPSAPELQRQFAEARRVAEQSGLPGAVALEVSSHGLDQGRVLGVNFDVAVFTNLSHDHLDYHETMAEYFEAKAQLFTEAAAAIAVIWTETPEGQELQRRRANGVVAVTWADAASLEVEATGSRVTWRGCQISLGLRGRPNVINTLLAAEAAVALGVDAARVAEALNNLVPVKGRMEAVASSSNAGPTVLVDYAHTPAALEGALEIARDLAPVGRLVVVFGCGGDRDSAKRPVMGALAARGADRVLITSDNPRSEDPAQIASEILAGATGSAVVEVELDRRAAIARAVDWAFPDGVVLVAGKGHETTQVFSDYTIAFDDVEVAGEILNGRALC